MKVIRIEMLKDFVNHKLITVLHKGDTHFATDGGDFWVVQKVEGGVFNWVVPKTPVTITPTAYLKEI